LRRFKVTVRPGRNIQVRDPPLEHRVCFVILTPREYPALKTRFLRKEPKRVHASKLYSGWLANI
jgi:hypothetical protein